MIVSGCGASNLGSIRSKKGERHRNQRVLVPSRQRNISTNDRDPNVVIWIWCETVEDPEMREPMLREGFGGGRGLADWSGFAGARSRSTSRSAARRTRSSPPPATSSKRVPLPDETIDRKQTDDRERDAAMNIPQRVINGRHTERANPKTGVRPLILPAVS